MRSKRYFLVGADPWVRPIFRAHTRVRPYMATDSLTFMNAFRYSNITPDGNFFIEKRCGC
jgi:hypothetical protein